MAFHTVREFGWRGLVSPATGFIPVLGIQVALLVWWWRSPGSRREAARWLMWTAAFQLVGGAILSVLPLPILPFVPAQTVEHYVSHLVFGLAQLPLLYVSIRGLVAARALRYP
jgi:hypothetical protein